MTLSLPLHVPAALAQTMAENVQGAQSGGLKREVWGFSCSTTVIGRSRKTTPELCFPFPANLGLSQSKLMRCSEMIVVGCGNNDTMSLQVAEGPCVRILAAPEGWRCVWMEVVRSSTEQMLIRLGVDVDVDVGVGVA
jgi:hypothetical protein